MPRAEIRTMDIRNNSKLLAISETKPQENLFTFGPYEDKSEASIPSVNNAYQIPTIKRTKL